jgi:hypothetical protein
MSGFPLAFPPPAGDTQPGGGGHRDAADLARLVSIGKPAVRVRCDLVETAGSPTVEEVLKPVLIPLRAPGADIRSRHCTPPRK